MSSQVYISFNIVTFQVIIRKCMSFLDGKLNVVFPFKFYCSYMREMKGRYFTHFCVKSLKYACLASSTMDTVE